MKTSLYRHFNSDGQLLYVGISLNWKNRLSQHHKDSYWFMDVTDISIEWFDSREDALKAERDAIKTEKPLCNKMHNLDGSEIDEKPVEEESPCLGTQVMKFINDKGKIFFKKGEVAAMLGVSNFYITDFFERGGIKPLQPFLPMSAREVYYIDDVVRCIQKIVTEEKIKGDEA